MHEFIMHKTVQNISQQNHVQILISTEEQLKQNRDMNKCQRAFVVPIYNYSIVEKQLNLETQNHV